MRWIRAILLLLPIGLIIFIGIYWNEVKYGWGQASGQFHVLTHAISMDSALHSPEIPDSTKANIRLIRTIRQYAVDSLGLEDTDSYETFYDQKGKAILWNVTASPPFEIKAYEWNFPFLGSFQYKGFFDYSKALEEAHQLAAEGYDTAIRTVSAWSTLGWFQDPILSGVVNRSEGHLANLIFHELTHATLYVKNDIAFNENLATLIGDRGARQFLKDQFGENSPELKQYSERIENRKQYTAHIKRGISRLDSLYESFDESQAEAEKRQQKQALIMEIWQQLDTIPYIAKRRKGRKIKDGFIPNNAYFSSFNTYRKAQNELSKALDEEFDGNIRAYINYLKEKYPSL